ncbi:hypothetical protein PhaeoP48_02937 [Phaeobacter inhibens]|uniref:hypothetical protein n=1 Tax=Phaeobacter inhibens TaxID=221822 RepID=UPI000CA1A19D|nr:hypothetical protein [Phaeobacter inhibens]AUR12899.1 hypothetical protein PhaeoP48_02937 [Phaeobacter inhibens]
MPLKQPMNSGIKDGKLVIDMAEADELWNGLSMDQQYEAMCIMFQPLLDQATAMKAACEKVLPLIEAAGREEVTDNRDWDEAEAMIRAAIGQST